jgi:hypothetical protein
VGSYLTQDVLRARDFCGGFRLCSRRVAHRAAGVSAYLRTQLPLLDS